MNSGMKLPSVTHPIDLNRHQGEIVVRAGDQILARSNQVVALREASYPTVYYFPRADVQMALLERTDHASFCPYKGDANYFSVPDLGTTYDNVAWSYEAPFPAVGEIAGHIAFYADRVAVEASC